MSDVDTFLRELASWRELPGRSAKSAKSARREARRLLAKVPPSLEPWRSAMEATMMEAALFRAEVEATTPLQSKLGGRPYFPKGEPWPTSADGRALQLLLQVNFADVPFLPLFPERGILQLFVDDRRWHDLDESLQVFFHEDVRDASAADFNDVPVDDFRLRERRLYFELHQEFMTRDDFRFAEALDSTTEASFAQASRLSHQLGRDYLRITHHRYVNDPEVGRGRNKLGGYHYSQNEQDPRRDLPGWQDSLLLVQFQDYEELSWGDGGSAQFFIKRSDLAARNFDDLLFHWDST